MSRRVPEAAVLVGVVLSLSFALYGVLFGDPLSTALVSVLVLYAFVGYAVRVDDDPAATLLPDPMLAAATVAGALALTYGLATLRPFLGLLVALVLVVPAALFHATHGESVNPLPPDATLALAAAAGVLVLLAGVALGRVTGDLAGMTSTAAFAAGVLVLGAAEYHTRRATARLPRRVEGAAVVLTLGGAALAVGYFAFVADEALAGLAIAVTLLGVGAYFALVDERRERVRRRRRRRRGGGGWF
ncbi:hypothetical protein [Haloglomus halophilum]|uniref:hypothetical protein n=1 Tax=Haloglomus halophilum TaxID=2962672 RepID=UPI0020C9DBC8|nr:hypothetical protein [Haloglomus halophilum]